jgi:hypothetical protein
VVDDFVMWSTTASYFGGSGVSPFALKTQVLAAQGVDAAAAPGAAARIAGGADLALEALNPTAQRR